MPLTSSQQEAIEFDGGNLQIIACAGSGKTEVVARRIARLLHAGQSGDLRPANIVAFTFTEKAAAELKDRIANRVREQIGTLPGLAELYVGTIHGYCLELLKAQLPNYLRHEVLGEVQRTLLVDRNSRQSGLTETVTLAGQQLKRYVDTKVYCRALDVLREDHVDQPLLATCSLAQNTRLYGELLEREGFLDYSGILSIAAEALEHNEALRQQLAGRIRHLIVDEYQDVNPVQERVVRALHDLGAALCVVGDDDQTIYQWRGSHVRNIISFAQRYPAVKSVRLQENFRSSRAVVSLARDFIAQNLDRLDKSMQPAGAPQYEEGDVLAMGFADPGAEAQFIVKKIQELRGIAVGDGDSERGLSYSDIAILLRSVARNGEVVVQALRDAGIPFIVVGLNGLFASAEARAARQSFFWLVDHAGATEENVRAAWARAGLGLTTPQIDRGIRHLADTRNALATSEGARWSQYSLQRTYLTLLERLGLYEGVVPDGHGEVAFYNFGKFSQVISDFEQINYKSNPPEKYLSFAKFLEYQAETAYEEGGQDAQHASPDAVRIMTVHQAKGMQWPAVFMPALLRNRFPAAGIGGRSIWHLIPREAVQDSARYDGGIEDERRLFYVAMTRAEKFLFLSWAPIQGNRRFQRASEFYDALLASDFVRRRDISLAQRMPRLEPRPRRAVSSVALSFSDLKYFFECPYQFKLRVLYGFNAPIHEALGYGKSLHDCLAEVHGRASKGDFATPDEAHDLVTRHLRTPFAYPELRAKLSAAAERVVAEYLVARQEDLPRILHFEKSIELEIGDGVRVLGRIDLVKHTATGQTSIVDLKSSDRTQEESITEKQLNIYVLGYEQLTGERADLVEIYNLDDQHRVARAVDDHFVEEVRADVRRAASFLRIGEFVATPARARCSKCDHASLCSDCEQ